MPPTFMVQSSLGKITCPFGNSTQMNNKIVPLTGSVRRMGVGHDGTSSKRLVQSTNRSFAGAGSIETSSGLVMCGKETIA